MSAKEKEPALPANQPVARETITTEAWELALAKAVEVPMQNAMQLHRSTMELVQKMQQQQLDATERLVTSLPALLVSQAQGNTATNGGRPFDTLRKLKEQDPEFPRYDGNPASFLKWLVEVEAKKTKRQLPDEAAIVYARIALDDADNGLIPKETTFVNWDAFTEHLKGKLLKDTIMYQVAFETRTVAMEEGQYLRYVSIYEQYRRFLPTSYDSMLLVNFIAGLTPYLRAKVAKHQPGDLSAAMDIGWRYFKKPEPTPQYIYYPQQADRRDRAPSSSHPTPMELDALRRAGSSSSNPFGAPIFAPMEGTGTLPNPFAAQPIMTFGSTKSPSTISAQVRDSKAYRDQRGRDRRDRKDKGKEQPRTRSDSIASQTSSNRSRSSEGTPRFSSEANTKTSSRCDNKGSYPKKDKYAKDRGHQPRDSKDRREEPKVRDGPTTRQPSRSSSQSSRSKSPCYNCGEVGHFKADCPNPARAKEKSYSQEDRAMSSKGKGKGA